MITFKVIGTWFKKCANRVWQEGCDRRQGEVEGSGEVGVGQPLLGVLSQQGVEGGLVVLILVLVLLDKAHQGTELARDQLKIRLALIVETVGVLKFRRQLGDSVDDLLLGGEVGGGVEEEDRAEEDDEQPEPDHHQPLHAAVAHLPDGRGGVGLEQMVTIFDAKTFRGAQHFDPFPLSECTCLRRSWCGPRGGWSR